MKYEKGDIVEATWDITKGLLDSTVICKEGTLLEVLGESDNKIYPIRVCDIQNKDYIFSVCEQDIKKSPISLEKYFNLPKGSFSKFLNENKTLV